MDETKYWKKKSFAHGDMRKATNQLIKRTLARFPKQQQKRSAIKKIKKASIQNLNVARDGTISKISHARRFPGVTGLLGNIREFLRRKTRFIEHN